MKKYIAKCLFLSIITCGVLSSCSDWLDVNDSPNSAESVEAGYLFNYAAVTWAGNRAGGDSYIPLSQSIQIQACGGDNYGGWSEAYYEISPYSTGNTWKHYYSVGGNNLKLAITQAENSDPVNYNGKAQCLIVLAQHMYEATMFWGDVPFSEAWNADIKYPKFDKQEDVLNGVIALLDEAITLIDPNNPLCIDEYDPYYGGDMNKWKALAHSLKFRTLITMVDKDPTKATTIGQLATSGNMITSSNNNFRFLYSTNSGNENPKYKILEKYAGGLNVFFFAHNNVLLPMQARNDARIERYFDLGKGEKNGIYRGLNTREDALEDAKNELLSSTVSTNILRKDAPELIYSYQEQLFFEAEVYARGLGVTKDLTMANTLYKQAITEACKYYGADAAKTTAFVNGLPNLNTLSDADALYEIHIQQWIDLMDRPLEAFTQWRRSGSKGNEIPTLTVPTDATATELIRRWEYYADELTANPNAPKESPKIWESMWFDE